MSDFKAPVNTHIDYWQDRWDKGATGWHMSTLNPAITEHLAAWLSGTHTHRIFFPLCGKTRDMMALAARGHYAVGLEAVPDAIEALEKDSEVAFTPAHPLSVAPAMRELVHLDARSNTSNADHQAAAARLRVLQGDLFALPTDAAAAAQAGAQFTAAFDRGSFVAIRPELRAQYAKVMSACIVPGGRVLCAFMHYDQAQMEGAPFAVSPDDIKSAFSEDMWSVEIVTDKDLPTSRFLKANGGQLEWCRDYVAIITRK